MLLSEKYLSVAWPWYVDVWAISVQSKLALTDRITLYTYTWRTL